VLTSFLDLELKITNVVVRITVKILHEFLATVFVKILQCCREKISLFQDQ
ncbi:16808_t:CDS:1, partial [Racocetra persica]